MFGVCGVSGPAGGGGGYELERPGLLRAPASARCPVVLGARPRL